jgi:hypothetical protein
MFFATRPESRSCWTAVIKLAEKHEPHSSSVIMSVIHKSEDIIRDINREKTLNRFYAEIYTPSFWAEKLPGKPAFIFVDFL